jgi:hypothetical protein
VTDSAVGYSVGVLLHVGEADRARSNRMMSIAVPGILRMIACNMRQ